MDCVDGHGPMLERRVAGQVVDHCAECRGTWLDPGELWRALARPVSDEENLRRHLVFEGLNMARNCPRCTTPLSNATVGTIVVSACMDCTGLWLDETAATRLKTYSPPLPAAALPPPPSSRPDPYDDGPNARPMTVHGAGLGQTEGYIEDAARAVLVADVAVSLVDVLFAVVRGVVPD